MSRCSSLINILSCLFITLTIMANAYANNTSTDIVIDGVLDDDAWETTPVIATNYQVFPQTLSKHHNNFSYRVITTEKGVFLGLKAKTQNTLRVRTQENDKAFSNDHFQIMLDINNNEQESYIFAINHQGNYFDGIYNMGEELT